MEQLNALLTEKEESPLDQVEDILTSQNWLFERTAKDELVVQVSGRSCDYQLLFVWQEDMDSLQFCCQYDFQIPDVSKPAAAQLLMSINENLWMGHFDLPQSSATPTLRYTFMMQGFENNDKVFNMIEDLIDISLAQCERHYAAFRLLSHTHIANDGALQLATMDTLGES